VQTTDNLICRQKQFEDLIRPLAGALYAAAMRRNGNHAAAEDLVQETYLRAWKYFDGFTPGTNFKAWIFQILRFAHVNERRKAEYRESKPAWFADEALRKSRGGFDDFGQSTDMDWETKCPTLADDAQKKALARLNENQRVIWMRVLLGGLSYQECAQELGIPLGTVMSRLFRARNQLRAELQPQRDAKRRA
jgi:RNA polymerase sigma-70 factor (ECF subfamily)